jgi:hypothetical protein
MAEKVSRSTWLLDRFAFVLVAVSATVVVLLLFELPRDSSSTTGNEVAVTLLTGLTLILALLVSGVSRPVLSFALLTAGVFVGWALISFFTEADSVGFLRWFWFLLVMTTPFVVVRRLVAHRAVTGQTLLGAASVYLLIAVALMFLSLGLDSIQSQDFFGHSEPTTGFMYFALVTVTSLGYGDLAPATQEARAVAAIGVVVGQVYLVFIVARMVALYTRTPRADVDAST